MHKQLILEIAPRLGLHLLSLGSDGAITEFQAQQSILNIQTNEKLIFKEPKYNINFSCPIFDHIGPIIRVQDSKHAKKTEVRVTTRSYNFQKLKDKNLYKI